MRLKKRVLLKNLGAALLLLLFAEYWSGSNLFYHTHTFNGKPLTHSHAFPDADSPRHNQQQAQLVLSLSNIVSTAAESVFSPLASFSLLFSECTDRYVSHSGIHPVHIYGLRAPPAFTF